MEHKVTELTEEQEEFIRGGFVRGRELLNRVEEFKEDEDKVSLWIIPKTAVGIGIHPHYFGSLLWVNAYPERVHIEFRKKEVNK